MRSRRASSATISQLSHRLAGRHRTQRPVLDTRRTLTCGYGLRRTRWTRGTDLRIKWLPFCGRQTGFSSRRTGEWLRLVPPYVLSDRLRRLKL